MAWVVDEVKVHDLPSDVVQAASDLYLLVFFLAPTHLSRDDLTVAADALGMALRVFVFDVDRRREGPDGIAIDGAQLVVQTPVLFRTMGHLFKQAMRVNADADMPDHRLDSFKVGV